MRAARQHGERLRRRLQRLQLGHQHLHRVFPGNRLILAGAAWARELQRALDAIGVIERLHRCLAARAGAAHADRMLAIALDFFGHQRLHALLLAIDRAHGFALHHAHADAAAGPARLTERVHKGLLAGHQLVGRHEQRNELLGRATPIKNHARRARRRSDFQKLPSLHSYQSSVVSRQSAIFSLSINLQ